MADYSFSASSYLVKGNILTTCRLEEIHIHKSKIYSPDLSNPKNMRQLMNTSQVFSGSRLP